MTFTVRTRAARLAIATTTLAALSLASTAAHAGEYLSREEVREFIDTMSTEHGIERAELERVIGAARHQPTVVRLIGPTKPTTVGIVRSYPAYRAKFLTKSHIAAGARYWEAYADDLLRAEHEYGVPAEVILGILGVETVYGRNTGSFRIVDALATIAFDGLRRQEYFRDELKELLLLAQETGFDPLSLKGSYAGAMGLPQFMPSSYRRYAVDFDADGAVDLVDSPADAIGSIASYLHAFGWVRGETARVPVLLPSGSESDLVTGLERAHSIAELKDRGVTFKATKLPQGACSVVELPTPGKPSKYFAGFANFEAVTRYNRSTFYATAVLELAEAIRAARVRQLSVQTAANSSPAS